MNTIAAQPNTYAVVGVDEASPPIFILPVIGWIGTGSGGSGRSEDRFDPVAIVNIGLENATKSAVFAGDALALSRKTQLGKFMVYVIDVVIGQVPEYNYVDQFKMILRNRKVK